MIYVQDSDLTIHVGDVRAVLPTLPAESVDCACGCGEPIHASDNRGRPRKFKRGHNLRVDHPLHRPGVVNWWLGRKMSDEAKAKLSAAARGPKPKLRGAGNGMFGRTGALNPRYIDGSSPERQRAYASAEWKAVVRTVRARDGYACTECGAVKAARRSLHLHHVKPWAGHPDLRFDPDNIVTLCADCHRALHARGGGAA